MKRVMGAMLGAALALVLLTGCASDPLAEQARSGDDKNYVAGDGTIAEIPPSNREKAVSFEGLLDTGGELSSESLRGSVVVVNFWYASCPPCRAEAADLQKASENLADQGVSFVGVNVRDSAEAARAFAEEFGVTYPSMIDKDGQIMLSFAGLVAPNAVPTTLVLDREGRVAARILGQIPSRSILETIASDTADEPINS